MIDIWMSVLPSLARSYRGPIRWDDESFVVAALTGFT
jgi:hypothetical protein